RFASSGRWMSMSPAFQANRPEARILWVSAGPEPGIEKQLSRLEAASIDRAASGLECCQALASVSYTGILANFPLLDCTAEELLAEVRRIQPSAVVWIRDAALGVSDAVRLAKSGADHVFSEEFDLEQFAERIDGDRSDAGSQAATQSAKSPPGWRKFLVGS